MTNLRKKIIIISTLISILVLSGCRIEPAIWNGRDRFHNKVTTIKEHSTVHFKNNSAYLSPDQVNALKNKVAKYRNVEKVYLAACTTGKHRNHIQMQRLRTISYWLKKEGYKSTIIANAIYKNPKNCVKVTFERLIVVPPRCPDVSGPYSNYYHINSNFGCSNVQNLGMMVANPKDLHRGKSKDHFYGTIMAPSIQRYDSGETKELIETSSTDIAGGDSD